MSNTFDKTRGKEKKKKGNVFKYCILIIFTVIFIFPIYWMIMTSIKTNDVLLRLPPEWIPVKPTLDSFVRVLSDLKFLTFYKNSIIVSAGSTILAILLAMHASYAFSRFKFAGSKILQLAFLSTQMFPQVALMIALYSLYKNLGLLDTYTALILACTTIALPLSTWILKGFYDTIPTSLEEAAAIDGCGRYMTFWKIIVPLIQPGILAVAIYAFLIGWDDFVWGLTLITKVEMRTLTPGIVLTYFGENSYDWAKIMTASVCASLPVLLVFIGLQKYMVSGLTLGAVKG